MQNLNFRSLLKAKDIIDDIVVVSLEDRPDRREIFDSRWAGLCDYRYYLAERMTKEKVKRIIKNFNGHDFPDNVEEETPARWGCFLSHFDCIVSAKARGLKSILLLEDDAVPNTRLMDEEFSIPPDWDVVYLGSDEPDVLAEFSSKKIRSDQTWLNDKDRLNFSDWKKIKTWGTWAMLIRDTVFDSLIKELHSFTFSKEEIDSLRLDGVYYHYLWKHFSFYYKQNFVEHDYVSSDIGAEKAPLN